MIRPIAAAVGSAGNQVEGTASGFATVNPLANEPAPAVPTQQPPVANVAGHQLYVT